jgi:hypothetical protein
MAGTRDNDIVQVTKQAVNVLRGAPPNNGPAVLDRKSALWVLAHMVGDLQQPLHVGAIYYADDCGRLSTPMSQAPRNPTSALVRPSYRRTEAAIWSSTARVFALLNGTTARLPG